MRTRFVILVAGTVLSSALPAAAQPSEADRFYREGTAARFDGRFEEAIGSLRQALEIQPDNADAQVQLGLALLAAGDLEAAEVAFRRTLEIAPGYADARIGLARIAFRREQVDKAAETLRPVLEEGPENADAVELAEQIEAAQAEQAENAERDAAAERERLAEERRKREAAEAAERQRREAARQAERALRERVELARLTEDARLLRTRGQFAESEARYREALRRSPGNADLLVGLGLTQGFQEDYGAAEASFEQALAADPASFDARLGLARVPLWTGQLDEAERRVQALLGLRPDDPEALALHARLFLARGQERAAEDDFAAIVAADPTNVEALVGLGDARRARYREERALEAYRAALALDPASADIRARFDFDPPTRWRLDLTGAYSDLSDGNDTWREGAIRLGYDMSPDTTFSLGADLSSRFGSFDAYLEGRVDHRVTPWLSAYVLLGGTPDADFRPDWQLGAGAGLRLLPGSELGFLGPSVATLDLRHADYATGAIQTVNPGLEQYLWDGRLLVTGRWINTFDEHQGHNSGWFLRSDFQVLDRLRVFGGLSDTPDISDGLVLDTFTTFGGAVLDISERVSISGSVTHEQRDVAYDRTEFSLGIGLRF